MASASVASRATWRRAAAHRQQRSASTTPLRRTPRAPPGHRERPQRIDPDASYAPRGDRHRSSARRKLDSARSRTRPASGLRHSAPAARRYTLPSASASRASRAAPGRCAPVCSTVRSTPRATADRAGCARAPVRAAGVAAAHELEITRGNFEARHVAAAACAEQSALEGCRASSCESSAGANDAAPRGSRRPEPAGRMQHVDVRQCAPLHASRWKRYRVSSTGASNDLPLKLTSAPARASSGDRPSSVRSSAKPREHELPRHECALVEPAAADQKRERPCAAAQPGRLEIEEENGGGAGAPPRASAPRRRRARGAPQSRRRLATVRQPTDPSGVRRRHSGHLCARHSPPRTRDLGRRHQPVKQPRRRAISAAAPASPDACPLRAG